MFTQHKACGPDFFSSSSSIQLGTLSGRECSVVNIRLRQVSTASKQQQQQQQISDVAVVSPCELGSQLSSARGATVGSPSQ